MEKYLLMCTCTQLHDGDNCNGVGAPVAQGGIGHWALKIHENYNYYKDNNDTCMSREKINYYYY